MRTWKEPEFTEFSRLATHKRLAHGRCEKEPAGGTFDVV